MQHETPTRALGVDRIGKRAEVDAALAKRGNRRREVRERAPQAIELPNNERVSGAKRFQRAGELRAEDGASGDAAVGKNLFASRSLKRVALQVQMLVSGGDACISDHVELSDGFFGLTSG